MYFFYLYLQADYILADVASEMLNAAGKRFEHISNIRYPVIDYTQELPEENFDLVIYADRVGYI